MKKAAMIAAIGGLMTAGVEVPTAAQDGDEPFAHADGQQIGTRFKRKPEVAGESERRRIQKDVAKCVVYRNKDLSRELLAKSDTADIDFDALDDLDPDGLFDELDVSDCLGRAAKYGTLSIRMSIPFRTLRNLMTEEVYLLDQKKPMTLADNAPLHLANRFDAAKGRPAVMAMAQLSDCMVHSDVATSDALIRSRPGSDEENEALEALHPAMIACAGPEAASAEVDANVVRMLIADGLWARMHYGPSAPVANDNEAAKNDDA